MVNIWGKTFFYVSIELIFCVCRVLFLSTVKKIQLVNDSIGQEKKKEVWENLVTHQAPCSVASCFCSSIFLLKRYSVFFCYEWTDVRTPQVKIMTT